MYFKIDGFNVFAYNNISTSIIQTFSPVSDINLFPVPAIDQLTIHANLSLIEQSDLQIVMIDAIGRQVKRQETINKEFHTMDIGNLPQGMYWCIITGKDGFIKNIPLIKK